MKEIAVLADGSVEQRRHRAADQIGMAMKPKNHALLMGAATVLAAALWSTQAFAQSHAPGAVFAGAEAGRDWSVSAGGVIAQPKSTDSRWAVRMIVATGAYDYSSGARSIDARYRQAEIVALRQRSGAWGYINFGAGVRYTHTTLEPDDVGNDRRGGQWDALITADGVRRAGAWEAAGFASYGIDMHEYYARGRLTHAVGSSPVRLGLEAVAQGDRRYNREGIAVVAIHRKGALELVASAGIRGGDGQVSLSVVRTF